MYCWDETVAKKGANEVISCLNNYFSGVVKVLTLYASIQMAVGAKIKINKWITVIERARKHNPFDVVKVGQSMVFDYQTHLP